MLRTWTLLLLCVPSLFGSNFSGRAAQPRTGELTQTGRPWLNLSTWAQADVGGSSTEFRGAVSETRVTASAVGDLTGDRHPDLVAAYSDNESAFVLVYPGNRDRRLPPDEETYHRWLVGDYEPPAFLDPFRIELEFAVTFLEVGDFDSDGVSDLVAAAREVDKIILFSGGRDGSFEQGKSRRFDGFITSVTSGEINRADGHPDLVIGLASPSGYEVQVLEAADGAWTAAPEIFPFGSEVLDLGLGNLNGDSFRDLAVSSANEMALILGRDRRLTSTADVRANVSKATLISEPFANEILGISVGDFGHSGHDQELALLLDNGTIHFRRVADNSLVAATDPVTVFEVQSGLRSTESGAAEKPRLLSGRVSLLPHEDLLVLLPEPAELIILALEDSSHVLNPQESTGETKPSWHTARRPLPARAILVETLLVNSDALFDLALLLPEPIGIVLAQSGPKTFVVTDPGDETWSCFPSRAGARCADSQVVFQRQGDGDVSDGICAIPPCDENGCHGPCTLRAAFEQASNDGGGIIKFGVSTVEFDLELGVVAKAPVSVVGNAGSPVSLIRSPIHLEAGSSSVAGVRMEGAGINVESSGNRIEDNWFGLSAGGGAPEAESWLSVQGSANTVAGNLFGKAPLSVLEGSSANEVTDNRVGLNAAGTAPAVGPGDVVAGFRSEGVLIDGTNTLVERNVVAGLRLGGGIVFRGEAHQAYENRIGTDAGAAVSIPNNGTGLQINGAHITIGSSGRGNTISAGTGSSGLAISGTDVVVKGNFIGGGLAAGLTGNEGAGIRVSGGSAEVEIGCDQSPPGSLGEIKCGNYLTQNGLGSYLSAGVLLDAGSVQLLGNLVENNAAGRPGVYVRSSGNTVEKNRIVSNHSHGIYIQQNDGTDGNNQIRDNDVNGNTGAGVFVRGSFNNTISGNRIWGNTGLGIDLFPVGVNENDSDDPSEDPGNRGANNGQNFPELTLSPDGTTVVGSLISTPGASFRIELFRNDECDEREHGEGQEPLQWFDVTADSEGKASFELDLEKPLDPAKESLTATATAWGGGVLRSTSEFSQCAQVGKEEIVVNSTGDRPLKAEATKCDTGETVLVDGAEQRECTLRAAIKLADNNEGQDTIKFDLPEDEEPVIAPLSPLPGLGSDVTIDARVFDGEACHPSVALDGSQAGDVADGLQVGSKNFIGGLAIFGWTNGISANHVSSSSIFQCNHIGTGLAGTETGVGNRGLGIRVFEATGIRIGGASIADRNIISGNGIGILVEASDDHYASAEIEGNYIGTDVTGSISLGNQKEGIRATSWKESQTGASLRVGGATSTPGHPPGNLISGNLNFGLHVDPGRSTSTRIEGNAIGVDASGRRALPNEDSGIVSVNNLIRIGGANPGQGNLISGNPVGIVLSAPIVFRAEAPDYGTIRNNRIGTSINPVLPLTGGSPGSQVGILIDDVEGPSNFDVSHNVIAFNGNPSTADSGGILTNGNTDILFNRIFDNVGLGIEYPVFPAGQAPDEPILESATLIESVASNAALGVPWQDQSGRLGIRGRSRPNTRIQFFSNLACDPEGAGEGETFLGEAFAAADGFFDTSLLVSGLSGGILTATSTETEKGTSQFARCLSIGSSLDSSGGTVNLEDLVISILLNGGDLGSFSSGSPPDRKNVLKNVLIRRTVTLSVRPNQSPKQVTSVPQQDGAVSVMIEYPEGTRIDSYYNYGPTPDNPEAHWYEFLFDGSTGAEIAGSVVTLHFVDGGRGDHDLAVNGVIETTGGIALSGKTLYVPFNQVSDSDSFVGLAVSNQSQEPQLFQFVPYNETGFVPLEGTGVTTRNLQGQSQLALLTTELFGTAGAPADGTWIELTSSTQELGSFFQFGKSNLNQLDGSVALEEQSDVLYFTRVFEGDTGYRGQPATTYLSIANPNAGEIEILLTLTSSQQGSASAQAGSPHQVAYSIPGKGFLYGSVSELFGDTVSESGGSVTIQVTKGTGAVGFEMIQLQNRETVIGLNASPGTERSRSFSAQLAWLPGFFTNINVLNTSTEARFVTLTAVNSDGSRFGDPVTMDLGPGEQFSKDAVEIFAGATSSSSPLQGIFVGSLRVESDGPGVVGDVLFGDGTDSQFAAALPLQSETFTRAVFNQVANLEAFFTGLAFYNPGELDNEITIEVIAPNGATVGEATRVLEAGQRLSQQVNELVPDSTGQAGGYVRITATQPLIAQLLFGGLTPEKTIKLMSAVPPTIIE